MKKNFDPFNLHRNIFLEKKDIYGKIYIYGNQRYLVYTGLLSW
jgi:hypothetical protein